MTKPKTLPVIQKEWAGCEACGLSENRGGKPAIVGAGNPNATYFVVTEQITQSAAYAGSPFGLNDGEVLIALLEQAAISIKDTYRTAVTGCVSFVVVPATEETEEEVKDRVPTKEEVAECIPRVRELIYAVDPALILAFGEIPWRALVTPKDRGKAAKLLDAQGRFFDAWIPGMISAVRYPVLVLPPISRYIADPSTAKHGPIATAIEYLTRAHEYITWLNHNEGTYGERFNPPQGPVNSR